MDWLIWIQLLKSNLHLFLETPISNGLWRNGRGELAQWRNGWRRIGRGETGRRNVIDPVAQSCTIIVQCFLGFSQF
jgi:hypothetical protein